MVAQMALECSSVHWVRHKLDLGHWLIVYRGEGGTISGLATPMQPSAPEGRTTVCKELSVRSLKQKTIPVLALSMAVSATPALHAEAPGGLGLGAMVGEPTGLTAKWWLDSDAAIDVGAAWALSDDDEFQLHVDYLVHRHDWVSIPDLQAHTPVYFGVGARVKFEEGDRGKDDDDVVGIRFPVGIALRPYDSPLEFFAELVPIVDVAPDSDFDLNAAVGGRYYFGK